MVAGSMAVFFVLSPKVIDHIPEDHTVWEKEPLTHLAKVGELAAYCHHGFWHPMDTLRDKNYLEELWTAGKAPWKIWPEPHANIYPLPKPAQI